MKPTPLLQIRDNLFVKCEQLQRSGSYKDRGVAELFRDGPRAASYATVSAGNLGRSLALACREHGLPCQVYLPANAPAVKKAALRDLGATLVELPFPEIFRLVETPPATHEGECFVHPFRTEALLRGYGNLGREILEQLPHATAIVLPFGLGGLFLGVQSHLPRPLELIAAEPETAAPLSASLAAGRPTTIERIASFIDAAGTPAVFPHIFERVRPTGTEVIPLEETRAALVELYYRHGLRVEGAAALAFAAAQRLARTNPEKKFVAVLTGGNLDPAILQELLSFSSLSPPGDRQLAKNDKAAKVFPVPRR